MQEADGALEVEVLNEPNTNMVLALQQAEIDTQIATAHRFPRSLAAFKSRALELVSIDEETAASCIYRRPVGKDPETGKQKTVEGESIRLAEIVLASYGNCRTGAQIIEMTPRYVKVRGYAHDLEVNNAVTSEVVESTVDRRGNPYSERQRAVIAKVALAKAIRDAAFKIVPKALCKPIVEMAKKVAVGNAQTLAKRRDTVMAWVDSLVSGGKKLDRARVFSTLGIKGVEDIGLTELETLTGIRTAIRDGDAKVDETFPPLEMSPEELSKLDPKAASAVTAEAKKPEATPAEPAAPSQGVTPPPADGFITEPSLSKILTAIEQTEMRKEIFTQYISNILGAQKISEIKEADAERILTWIQSEASRPVAPKAGKKV